MTATAITVAVLAAQLTPGLVQVILGALAVVSAIGVALIDSNRKLRNASHTATETAERVVAAVGTPNGQGDVVTMMERLLRGQTEQDQRLASIDHRLSRGDDRMRRIEDDQRIVRGQLDLFGQGRLEDQARMGRIELRLVRQEDLTLAALGVVKDATEGDPE